MRAIILAGGKGTRLRPLTLNLPKPLVPIGDMPILEVVIRQLSAAGFSHVTISTGYLAELIQAHFGDGAKWGLSINYVHEEVPLSTAGPLKLIDDLPEHVLVMNGDVLTDIDYAALVRAHLEAGAAATVATKRREAPIDFGVVEADADGWLENWREKPTYSFEVSMGVYVVSREAVGLIGDGEALGEAADGTHGSATSDSPRVLDARIRAVIDQMQAAVARLDEWSVQLRDIEDGLADFPALVNGRQVWLCWQLGEEDEIHFWHDLTSGFGGRRPLIELT